MSDNLDNLLLLLDDEIEKKCYEIKLKKTEKALKKIFVLGCILFTVIPIILIFMGLNAFSILLPIVFFITISFTALTPLILNDFGGII